MMWKTKRYAYASALPAIAAALALSSTPAWSQEVQPTAEPDPVTIDAPVVESPPATTDATTITDTNSEPTTVTEAAPVAAKPKAKPTKSTQTVTAKRPTATRVASTAAPVAAATPVTAPAAPSAPQPIVDARPPETDQAAVAPEEATKPAMNVDEDALMLGGGALALLALGGGAFAMARRRRQEDNEEIVEETAVEQPMTIEPETMPRHDVIHDEQPAIVAPSAFAWGNEPKASAPETNEDETWVERAYRGPTPDNPSLSLRKRLKRANFFDARERRVAAGKAEPIEADAGLPENVANDTRERELELA